MSSPRQRTAEDIVVRRAARDDLEVLVHFNRSMAKETEGKALDTVTLRLGIESVFDDPRRGNYLIAEVDGRPVGGLLITTEWSDWRNGYYWWIQSVYVRPEHRKRGVYSRLHRFVEKLAAEQGDVCGIRLYVDRHNRAAQATYRRLGMSPARYDFFESTLLRKAP